MRMSSTMSALVTKKVIENAFEILAIELITVVQAIEHLELQAKVSSKTKALYEDIRNIVPPFAEDQVMYPYLKKVKDLIQHTEI